MTIIDNKLENEIKIYLNATIDTLLIKYDKSIVTNIMLKDSLMNEKKGMYKPFHEALIPIELFRYQAFFRSFSTSLGSGVFEFLAKQISLSNTNKWNEVKKGKFEITTDDNITQLIGKYLDKLEKGKADPTKDYSLPIFPSIRSTNTIKKTVDLYLKSVNNIEYFIEIKSPKPNKGQSKDTKRDLLKLKATYPQSKIILGLTFNPYGEKRENFKNSYLPYYFDLNDSNSIKIGSEFWNFLGDNNTYNDLLNIFKKVGDCRKSEIKEKLLD